MKFSSFVGWPVAVKVLAWLCWLHLAGSLVLLALLYLAADSWWPATVLMFGPRWLWALPLALLAPAAAVVRPRLLLVACIDLALILGPLTGFCIPSLWPDSSSASAPRVRVLTCNVHWKELDAAALAQLIVAERPDVVALQGWSSRYQETLFGKSPSSWHCFRQGELMLASVFPIVQTGGLEGDADFPHPGSCSYSVLVSPAGKLHFVNLHLASPREGLVAVAKERWAGAGSMRVNSERRHSQSAMIVNEMKQIQGPLLIAGDFNTPPESVLMREFWSPYADAYASASWGWGHTHFTRWESSRIDHIMAGPGWHCCTCKVGPNVGSPHRPLIAELEWRGSVQVDGASEK